MTEVEAQSIGRKEAVEMTEVEAQSIGRKGEVEMNDGGGRNGGG
jgi:hypothetical protein